jgi:general secretion pathway protein G
MEKLHNNIDGVTASVIRSEVWTLRRSAQPEEWIFVTLVHLLVELRYPKRVNLIANLIAQSPAHGFRVKKQATSPHRVHKRIERGITLLELMIATSILLVLATAALPVFRMTVVRTKEAQLHKALREIRDAIDRYKDYSDRNLIRVEVGSEGYPPDLETLVKGVQIGASSDRKVRFLRRIPVDPMTGRAEWNLQSVQDDPDSTSWGGSNVFDVHSKSQATALDGTKYADW